VDTGVARDIAHGEKVEAFNDAFIAQRDSQRRKSEGDRRAEEMWAQSVARFHERSEAEMRSRWVEYHRHLQILHQGLADEHEAEAEKLENGHEKGAP
jgi:hypothetical protein